MKNPLLLLLSGTALFAGGYFVRDITGAPASPDKTAAPARSVIEQINSAPAAPEKSSAATGAVRDFVPGRPFPKGGAKEWILTLTPGLQGDNRGRAIAQIRNMQLFFTMDEESVREAMAAIGELIGETRAKNPTRRINHNGDGVLDSLLEMSLLRLAHLNPNGALQALQKNLNLNDGGTKLLVMGTFAASDPAGAEQLALSMEKKDQRREALRMFMYGLMSQNPVAALAFTDRHPEAIDDHERKDIFEGWVRNDPLPAMAAAVQATVKSGNPEMVRNTIEEWVKVDPDAAAKWAATYDGPGGLAAKAMMLERRAREDPQAALPEYAALLQASGDPKELARLTAGLADAYADKDVTAARAWAETLPSGDLRDRALHQVLEQWVKNDAPAASEWIKAQPPGSVRDGAARELAGAIARSTPADAFEWARNISDAKLRGDALQNVIKNWRELDPEAAKQAVESLPLEMRPKP